MSETAAARKSGASGTALLAGMRTHIDRLTALALVMGAFALYWGASCSIEQRGATTYFGADTWHYTELAAGEFNDRIMRLHPVTVILALGWMKMFSPLSAWIEPLAILKAMFALAGALGVWAALHAFSAFMPRRHALLWAAIYGSTVGIWYFSSIEESKIVSATLSAAYIAFYVHLRENFTRRGVFWLTAILFVACLNEITAAFLGAIPAVDAFLKSKFRWRSLRWVVLHGLGAVTAFAVLEIIKRMVVIEPNAEGTNFVEIFFHYVGKNTYSLGTLTDFLLRWMFFNIAAPEAELNYAVAQFRYGGDFETTLLHYFDSPLSIMMVLAFAIILVAGIWYRSREPSRPPIAPLMLGLFAYALTRMVFFFIFLPGECLLYSPSVTLAHLLMLAIAFAVSRFPYKGWVIGIAAATLFINNALFMFTAQTIPLATP